MAVAVAVVIAAGVGGAAFAYWTSGGSGTGGADTGTAQPVALSSGALATPLYPGGQTDVELTVTNPNLANTKIGTISLDTSQGSGGFDVDAGHAACDVSTLSFTTQTNGGAGWTLPPRVGAIDGSLDITLPNALSMATSAANACQGATFTIYLEAGP